MNKVYRIHRQKSRVIHNHFVHKDEKVKKIEDGKDKK